MKIHISGLVSGVGIEPTEAHANGLLRKDLQACKPRRAKGALVLACALTAVPAFAQDRPSIALPASVFVLSQAADWDSTQRAIRSGNGREGNPLMQVGSGEQAAIKVGASIAIVYVAHRINRSHPRLAKGLLWFGSAGTFALAGHNYRLATKPR